MILCMTEQLLTVETAILKLLPGITALLTVITALLEGITALLLVMKVIIQELLPLLKVITESVVIPPSNVEHNRKY